MKRVLLTGIGGSIGCHVMAHILRETDWEIVGVDSFRHKGLQDRVLVMCQQNGRWRTRIRIFTHDLRAPISYRLSKSFGRIDGVINLASLTDVEESITSPADFIQSNVAIAVNVFEWARRLALEFFHQASTDEVYGPSGPDDTHAEWSTILPSNPYAASKAAQEAIAIAYWRSYNLPLILTNLMNNFGEMQQAKKFPAMVQKQVARGQTVKIHGTVSNVGSRYYLHSRSFADALLFILQNVKPYFHQDGCIDRPHRFNIVGDRRVDNLEMARMIAGMMGKPLDFEFVDFHRARPGHDRHYGLDGSKLRALGWKAPRTLEEELQATIDWQMENPEWIDG